MRWLPRGGHEMRIGELAKSVGVTPDTIRYYEREGLLPLADRTPYVERHTA